MLTLNFTPFPVLETNRLLLRQLILADTEALFFLRSDEEMLRYLHKEPAKNTEEVMDFIKKINDFVIANESILWAIALKENPLLCMGTICFWNIRKEVYRAEIGYLLHPALQGKGVMKEAIQSVINYGFTQIQLHSIDAVVDPRNIASVKNLESFGFTKEAYLKEDFSFAGQFWDSVVYSLHNKS